MSDPVDAASGIMRHWEVLTGILAGILAVFGVIVKRKDGKTIVTQKDLDLLDSRIDNRILKSTSELKKAINDSMSSVYSDISKNNDHINGRVDEILKERSGRGK